MDEKHMQENYLISITNKQCVEGRIEEFNLTTTGSYLERNGKRYIVYQEYDENCEVEQTSTLKISENTVSLLRHNQDVCHTNLILENGKRHLCQYGTPYGEVMMGIFTTKLVDSLTDEGGDLTVEYLLDVNSSLSSVNSLTISVKENQPPTHA